MTHRRICLWITHYALRTIIILLFLLTFAHGARADVAPPEQPPGSNIDPGNKTQVRMVSERVVLDVQGRPTGEQRPQLAGDAALAQVNADFQMRNLGGDAEHLQVRFPLGDPSGQSSGFGEFPQVQNFAASVNGQHVATTVITSTNPQDAD